VNSGNDSFYKIEPKKTPRYNVSDPIVPNWLCYARARGYRSRYSCGTGKTVIVPATCPLRKLLSMAGYAVDVLDVTTSTRGTCSPTEEVLRGGDGGARE
jgi:hypothetical protein